MSMWSASTGIAVIRVVPWGKGRTGGGGGGGGGARVGRREPNEGGVDVMVREFGGDVDDDDENGDDDVGDEEVEEAEENRIGTSISV